MSEDSPVKREVRKEPEPESESQSEEDSDNGAGISSNNVPYASRNSEAIPYTPKRAMDSTDEFLLKHNPEGIELTEEEKEQLDNEFSPDNIERAAPRNTYEVMLEKKTYNLKKIKVAGAMNFDEKKRYLAGKDYSYSEAEWREILKNENKNKLYEISNKRLKESMIKGRQF